MSYHGPKAKLARRFGVSWTPKGDKILARRPNPPGQHGASRRRGRDSVYKKQLTQKQLLRAQYNIREKQMRNYIRKALESRGNYDERLIQLLETRLDALVLRAGFAQTIYAARQYVNHGHVLVNDHRVTYPSYAIKPGDQISIKEKSKAALSSQILNPPAAIPPYLESSQEKFSAQLLRLPVSHEVPVLGDVRQVIEFYSR
ncbi:MAG: small subunit ribosomal protein [Chloroflexota bacterium]|nr:small subunit ribosomal protein [Chloroflexota bacterium]